MKRRAKVRAKTLHLSRRLCLCDDGRATLRTKIETVQNRIDPIFLVQYVTWLATQRDTVLTPLRLVKLLYLADLYYARENEGRTLTGWPWAFVHYGPYCREAMDAIKESVRGKLLTAIPYEGKFDGEEHEVYRSDLRTEPKLEDELPIYVTSPLKGAVRQWADDSASLLDHVYFETEPMLTARPYERLDFSKSRRTTMPKPINLTALSADKLKAARGRVQVLKQKYQQEASRKLAEIEQEPRDEVYEKAMAAFDGEPLKEGIAGKAAITVGSEDDSH
jgi:Protein of unknown function (DUF4065)